MYPYEISTSDILIHSSVKLRGILLKEKGNTSLIPKRDISLSSDKDKGIGQTITDNSLILAMKLEIDVMRAEISDLRNRVSTLEAEKEIKKSSREAAELSRILIPHKNCGESFNISSGMGMMKDTAINHTGSHSLDECSVRVPWDTAYGDTYSSIFLDDSNPLPSSYIRISGFEVNPSAAPPQIPYKKKISNDNTLIIGGKHDGKTYKYVEGEDLDYCRRVISRKGEVQNKFYHWLVGNEHSINRRSTVSSLCPKSSPELKSFISRAQSTPPDRIYDPGVLLGEPQDMRRYGWFIDYVVRWQLYLDCKDMGVPINEFTCKTRGKCKIMENLRHLLISSRPITDPDTLNSLWIVSFSSILSYNGGANDIPMPRYDMNTINKICIFTKMIAIRALTFGGSVNISHRLSGKRISGEADIIVSHGDGTGDLIIDIKLSAKDSLNIGKYWKQLLIYSMLRIDQGHKVNSMAIYDVNSGLVKFVDITDTDIENVRLFTQRYTL